MIYVIWNNGAAQQAMGYWLKSFNTNPPPVPGTHFSIPQINNRELTSYLIVGPYCILILGSAKYNAWYLHCDGFDLGLAL